MILDDENILIGKFKEDLSNPFFLLKQIFIRANEDNNGILFQYRDDILNILKSIKLPEHTKWYINYNTIELVDEGYYGEVGDYYKIFACISFYPSKRLIFDIKISRKFIHRCANIYCDIIGELTKRKYDLVQMTNHIFVYK